MGSRFRNCPADSHPSGGFPVSKFEIILFPYALCPMLYASSMEMKWRKSFSETKNNLVEIYCPMLK